MSCEMKKNVLIVDKHPQILNLLCKFLEKCFPDQFIVFTSTKLDLKSFNFDLLILEDYNSLEEVQKLHNSKDKKIIACISNPLKTDWVPKHAIIVNKPFVFSELAEAICSSFKELDMPKVLVPE